MTTRSAKGKTIEKLDFDVGCTAAFGSHTGQGPSPRVRRPVRSEAAKPRQRQDKMACSTGRTRSVRREMNMSNGNEEVLSSD